MTDTAVEWTEFERADPDLAQRVQQRLASHLHAVMATLRADGAPRLSGMEVPVRSGQLWLAMMPESQKAADLARDRRFALHSAPDAESLPEGDARIDGLAVPADAAQTEMFMAEHRHHIEDPTKMVLYVGLIRRAVLVRVADDQLLIESWTPATGHATHQSA